MFPGLNDVAALDISRGPVLYMPYLETIAPGASGAQLVYSWPRACTVVGLQLGIAGNQADLGRLSAMILDATPTAIGTDGQFSQWINAAAIGGADQQYRQQWLATRIQIKELDTWTIQMRLDASAAAPATVFLLARLGDPVT